MEKPSLRHIISTGQKTTAELHARKPSILLPSVLLSWPFTNSSGFTSEIPPNEQSVPLGTVRCPQVQHKKCCGRYRSPNRGAHLMEARKNAAVLLLEGCHGTRTYTLPFSVGIQPKQMQGSSQQKGGEHSVSAANKQLEPPTSLSVGCSWTTAFLWSSRITRSLFCLFSEQSFADFLSGGRETQMFPCLSFKKSD